MDAGSTGGREAAPDVPHAARETLLEVRGPAVGGVPLVHRLPQGWSGAASPGRPWAGSRVDDEPLVLTHRLGPASVEGLTQFARGPYPLSAYLLDERGAPAIVSDVGGAPRQCLRTLRPGREYELSYERVPERGWEWVWQRALFMLALPARRRGLLVHASAFLLPDGRAVLCPGSSGIGKSTLAAQIHSDFGHAVPVLSDERVVLTLDGDGAPRIWGTPWHSTAGLAEAHDGLLVSIVLPSRGDVPSLTDVPAGEIVPRIVGAFALPFWDDVATDWALGVVDRVVSAVPVRRFSYRPRPGAGIALVEALTAVATP